MTAKDEDILSSRTLLKKGVAIERFMENIIVDKKIKVENLLVGDRNAIIIAARVSGYGPGYETKVNCPACGHSNEVNFNLNDKTIITMLDDIAEELQVEAKAGGLYQTTMPYSKFKVEFRLLTGTDEIYMTKSATSRRKQKMTESMLTDQYKRMVVSIEGHTGNDIVNKYVDNMPTLDSRHLKACYRTVCPDVKITEEFECSSCSHEQELEVPFGADFFWPDR